MRSEVRVACECCVHRGGIISEHDGVDEASTKTADTPRADPQCVCATIISNTIHFRRSTGLLYTYKWR